MSWPRAFYGAWGLPPLPAAPGAGCGPRSHRASTKASLCGARQGRMSPGRQPGRHGKASGPLPGPPRPRVYSTASTRGRRQSRTMAMGTLGHCWCLVQCQGHRGCWLGAVSEGAHCKGTGCPCALGPVPTATGPSCVSRCSMGRGVWCTHTCTRPCTHTRVHAHPHAQRCPHMCTPVNAFSGHGCAHRHEKAPACTHNSLSLVHLQICTRVSVHGQAHVHRAALARPPHTYTPHVQCSYTRA